MNINKNLLAWLIVFAKCIGVLLGVIVIVTAFYFVSEAYTYLDENGYFALVFKCLIFGIVITAAVALLYSIGRFFIDLKNDQLQRMK